MALTIKAYENRLDPKAAVMVVTTDKYTHVVEVADVTGATAKSEKIAVESIVAAREKILIANQKLIDAKVAQHTGQKEIDFSGLVRTAGDKP